MFLFLYHCPGDPKAAPFSDLFVYQEKWYATRAVQVMEYREHMTTRSEKWGTVNLPTKEFRRLAKPFEEWL